jgi:predicted membrane metal-binding protein
MNRFILLLACVALLSSCEPVLVWTFDDVFGLSCLGIAILYVIWSVIKDCFPKKKKK